MADLTLQLGLNAGQGGGFLVAIDSHLLSDLSDVSEFDKCEQDVFIGR
jgi:hypothetical protein